MRYINLSAPPETVVITGCEGCNEDCNQCLNNIENPLEIAYRETEYSKWLKENCPF